TEYAQSPLKRSFIAARAVIACRSERVRHATESVLVHLQPEANVRLVLLPAHGAQKFGRRNRARRVDRESGLVVLEPKIGEAQAREMARGKEPGVVMDLPVPATAGHPVEIAGEQPLAGWRAGEHAALLQQIEKLPVLLRR